MNLHAASITARSCQTGRRNPSRAEDTFEHDIPLVETESLIRRLAEKVWAASRKESRIARTVVLKLKTSEFNILTRSHTPSSPPASCEELAQIALSLRERIDLGARQHFRLVGVGLSNFRDAQGRLNQIVAAAVPNVVFIAAGLPLWLKRSS